MFGNQSRAAPEPDQQCLQMSADNSSRFDFSQWDFPVERIWLRRPPAEITWKICTFVPLIVLGLYGNLIIIYLIATNRSLRSPTNLIIANMALADLLTLLICPAMFLVTDFYQNYELGCVGCKLEGFLVIVFLITGVLNMSVVSYDRLTAIVLPSETRLNLRGAQIVIACTWLGGVLFALPLALYRSYRVRLWKNFRESYCKENTSILNKYWYVLITILVWLPLGIMLICYAAIFYKLDRYEKRVLRRENPLTVNYKRSVAKTLFIVVAVFAVLRLPFTILVVLRAKLYATDSTVDSGMRLFGYIAQYLMFLNAAVNPYIYGFNNENFRRAYKQKRAAQANGKHYCCYCSFMKRPKPSVKPAAINTAADVVEPPPVGEMEDREGTDKDAYKSCDGANDSLVPQIDSEGFI